MVIAFGNAQATETAVFRPCWLNKVAGPTHSLRPEQNVIKRIVKNSRAMVLLGDEVGLARDRKVCKDVGQCDQWRHWDQQVHWQEADRAPKKDRGASSQKKKEKYLVAPT